MRIGVLGPLELSEADRPLSVGPPKQRAVLGLLLVHAGEVVSVDQITDLLWRDQPPRTAGKNIQVYVWKLRKLLGDRLVSAPPGYRLCVESDELDCVRFNDLVDQARAAVRAGRREDANRHYRQALSLWRGPAYADLLDFEPLRTAAHLLEQRKLLAVEEQVDVELALGRHAELIPRLEELVTAYPLHERLREQLVLALHRAGRSAEAWAAYQEGVDVLAGELGVEPGPGLQRLARAIRDDATAATSVVVPAGDHRDPFPVRQLPPAVPSFTGRGPQLARLRTALAHRGDTTVVPVKVVTGPAGAGKSALAIQVGHQLAEDYPDGQLYVDLHGATAGMRPLSPGDVLARFLRTMGVADSAVPRELEEAAARYRSLVARRRLLVVLDNAADAEQVRPLLPANPGCAVLITARRPLADLDGADHLRLDHLTPEAATALLSRLVGQERTAADPRATADVVRWSEGLPLAVRIAGAKLAAHTSWTVATLRDRLADERRRLTELSLGDRAVRTSFRVSYQSLAHPVAARMFRLLGLLDGPDVSLPAAAALLGASTSTTQEALEELVDARLVDEAPPGRYRMHDLIRLFARECAADQEAGPDRNRALLRMLTYQVASTQRADSLLRAAATTVGGTSPTLPTTGDAVADVVTDEAADRGITDRDSARTWLDTEYQNLQAAIRQAAESAVPDLGRLAIDLVRHLFWYLRNSYVKDWLATSRAGCDLARRLGETRTEAILLGQLADGYIHGHQLSDAKSVLERGLALYRRLGDAAGEAEMLNKLGVTHTQLHEYDTADRCYQQSLRIRRRLGDRVGEAGTAGNIGSMYAFTGRLEQALLRYRYALRLARSTGSRGYEANLLTNLGIVHGRMGRYEESEAYLEQALAVYRDISDALGIARCYHNLCDVHAESGDLERAVRYAERCLEQYRTVDSPWWVARSLQRLGVLRCRQRDLAAARRSLQAALEIYAHLGAPQKAEVSDLLEVLSTSVESPDDEPAKQLVDLALPGSLRRNDG